MKIEVAVTLKHDEMDDYREFLNNFVNELEDNFSFVSYKLTII